MKEYLPLNENKLASITDNKLFLAGTIDNGQSLDWQKYVVNQLQSYEVAIYNPRRADWNPKATEAELIDQIQWEQKHINSSNLLLFNFLPDSKSPITFMELGYALGRRLNETMGDRQTIYVVCPKEFYRYTNVKVMCSNARVYHFETIDSAIEMIKTKLGSLKR